MVFVRKSRWHSLSLRRLRVIRELILSQQKCVGEGWKISSTSGWYISESLDHIMWISEKAARKSYICYLSSSPPSPSFFPRTTSLSFSCMQCTNFLFRLSTWEKFPSKWKLDAISLYPLSFLSLNLSDPIFERNFPSTTTCGWMPNSYLVCMWLSQSNRPGIRDM